MAIRDVTQHQTMGQEQALLETLFAQAREGLVFLDRDLRFLRINERLAEMNGLSVAAHLGRTVAEIVPTREATLREVTARILATGQPVLNHEFSSETARAPGVTRCWNESWYPVQGEHGEIIGFSAVVEDVTERKNVAEAEAEAEAALRGNTALFYKIIDQAPGGVYVVDAQFRVVQMNAESLPFFASAQPLIGRDFDEALGIVWGPEIGPQIASTFRHTLATGERYVSPRFVEQRHDIGVEQAFEWETQRITLPDGQFGVVCYFKDVTVRERTEAARRDNEERLRLAIAGADLGTWHWDLRTGEMDWSERCLKIFGIPPGTAMSHEKFLGALHSEDRARADAAVQHALQNGSEYRIEFRNVWPDGSLHWAVSLGRVYCDTTDKPIRMEGIALDITERKRTEAALRETEQHYQALAEASSEIAYRLSADWSTLLPLDGRELVASSDRPQTDWAWLDQHLPRDEHARVRQAIGDAIARKGLFELEHRVVRPDGSTGWTRSRAVPILDENDDLVAWFGAASDITERKRIELNLIEATANAEKANRAKSDFLSNMSHELRTPLNALMGLTGLLIDSPLGRRQREYAEKMDLSAQTLRTLVDDILDFRRIEAGALRLEHAPLSLNTILHTTTQMLGVSLGNKPVEALLDVAPDVPDALVGDALRLQQILLNLTSNAAKFTQAGEIVISVRCLACAEPTPSGPSAPVTLEFTVRDTGIGIARDQVGSIFNEFFQAASSTSRLHGGSGLGLSISARLAQLMGGRIEVDSNPGQGSEFRLRVPMTPDTREQPTNTAFPPCPLPSALPSAISILIVDDHALSRSILCRTCASFGWQAKAVDSGAAALAELQRRAAHDDPLEGDFDLLLLDWRMPDQDGLTMLRQAYAAHELVLPLVILMAPIFELEAAVAAGAELNLDGIVTKPVTPASLREAVRRTYEGESTARLPHLTKIDQRLSGMRLLVAEDNELNQEVIEQMLARAGAEVVIAANGLEAVAALKVPGARFDAVLMDIQMPVMNGYSATRAIREELGMTDLPIIAVTAYARPEDREKSRLAGMVGHLVKPIKVDDLLDIVSTQRSTQAGAPAATVAAANPGKREVAFTGAFMGATMEATTALTTELPSLDVETALRIFAGDAAMYAKLLRKFAQQHGHDDETARRLIAANDATGAAQLMHNLSGMAGFLQAAEVAHLSAALEQALLANDARATAVLLDEVQQAMQTVRDSIDKFEAMHGAKGTV